MSLLTVITSAYRRASMLALLAATAFAGHAPAHAVAASITFTGTIDTGIDPLGQFGAAGGDLSGKSFSMRVFYNTDDILTSPFDPDLKVVREGITSSITIGGMSFSQGVPVEYYSSIIYDNTSTSLESGLIFYLGFDSYIFNSLVETVSGQSLRDSYERQISGFNRFQLFHSIAGGPFQDTASGGVSAVTSLVGTMAAVPEPATWATMLLGFGLVGGALRRRAGRLALVERSC